MNIKKLKAKMVEKNMTADELSRELDISTSTFYRKLNSGERFTVGEAGKISKCLELTTDEVNHIFFENFVA